MNPLLQATKVDIIERETFSTSCIFDKYILAAIEAYDIEGSSKLRAQAFVKALTPLWSLYHKESYISLFRNFIEMEIGLEALSESHSSHVNHVIQEFLFGYNILMNCEYLKREYRYSEGNNDPMSDYGKLFFSWMAASLFHDVGYDIERAPEEEAFRENKNVFWSFMTRRSITQDPLSLSPGGEARDYIENYILTDLHQIPGAPKFSLNEFEKLFMRPVANREGWFKYDHGVISAIKYYTELGILQGERGGEYLNWEPNRNAALAMALHNFRYKNVNLQLSCGNRRSLIPYLLIVSDEVQEWERERFDIDTILPNDSTSGAKAKKATELAGIVFRDKRAYVILNHKLKDPSLRNSFEKYLDNKIQLMKEHYPIRVMFAQLRKKIRDEVIKSSVEIATNMVSPNMTNIVLNFVGGMIELKPESTASLSVSALRMKRLVKIANTKCEKELLRPTHPNPIYEVFVDHRIEGDPYLTVAIPF